MSPSSEELHILYRSANIVRVIKSRGLRWADHVANIEDRSAFKILTGRPTGKRSLGRPKLKEIGINTRHWVDSNPDRDYWRVFVNAALNLRVS